MNESTNHYLRWLKRRMSCIKDTSLIAEQLHLQKVRLLDTTSKVWAVDP